MQNNHHTGRDAAPGAEIDSSRLLSDAELHSRLETLVRSESGVTTEVAQHLAEVERRKLFASLGYSSLYDYATRGLGYSGSAAFRRIKLARVGRKLPMIYDYLKRSELSLSAIETSAEVLLAEGGEKVLEQIRGLSRREVEKLAHPPREVSPATLRDRIEPVVIRADIAREQTLLALDSREDSSDHFRGGSTEVFHRIQFTVGEEFVKKLERVKELAFGGKREDVALPSIFEEALDLYLAKHCPRERSSRREVRLARQGQQTLEARKPEEQKLQTLQGEYQSDPEEPFLSRSRYIPLRMRDEVLRRDGYCCTFVGLLGKRCECRSDLEIDHINPFALGGETAPENLRTLCRTHNMLEAISAFGREFVEKKLESRR